MSQKFFARLFFKKVVACLILALAAPSAHAKGPIHGLVTMGSLYFVRRPGVEPDNGLSEAKTHPGLYAGAVVSATWEELEPTRGQFDFAAIDRGLASVRAYNARHSGARLVAKLRIFAGLHSPDWVMRLDGGPIRLMKTLDVEAYPHFWSGPYRAAWRVLQQRLAARYDDDGLVAEVAVSSCSSTTAEPFVMPLPENLSALVAAGYTDAAMEACLMGAIDDYAPWRHTAIDYTFNPFRVVMDGRVRVDDAFTRGVMRRFRARYGARGVVANHGLEVATAPHAVPVYAELKALGPPMAFQTKGPREDWDAAVAKALAMGMTELEVWNTREDGGVANVTARQLRRWRQELEH